MVGVDVFCDYGLYGGIVAFTNSICVGFVGSSVEKLDTLGIAKITELMTSEMGTSVCKDF